MKPNFSGRSFTNSNWSRQSCTVKQSTLYCIQWPKFKRERKKTWRMRHGRSQWITWLPSPWKASMSFSMECSPWGGRHLTQLYILETQVQKDKQHAIVIIICIPTIIGSTKSASQVILRKIVGLGKRSRKPWLIKAESVLSPFICIEKGWNWREIGHFTSWYPCCSIW